MVLDKLKFWKNDDDDFSRYDKLSDDPMARQTDPLQDASDPLSSPAPDMSPQQQPSFESMDQGSSFSPNVQHPDPGSGYTPTSAPSVPEYDDYPEGRDRDMELVLAKLDSIKSELDSLHQRVRKIEQSTERKASW